jgi:hypothetical protein
LAQPVHSARSMRLAGPASACAARDMALRASARRSGHRSPGTHRGAASGDATTAEVVQTAALEHSRRRGYPPGMGEGAIAHRSSSSTGRGRKPARRQCFSDEVRAPVAGGGPTTGRREREVSSALHGRETVRGGLGRRSPWAWSRRRRRPDSDGLQTRAGRRLQTG